MSIRNPGPLLTSIFRGTLEHIPPEWRAKLELKKLNQQQPNDVDEDSLSGQLIGSQVERIRARNKRKKTNVQLLDSPTGKSLVQKKRLANGQIAVRTRTFPPEGTDLVPPTDAVEAAQHNLGVGWLDQTVN